MTRRVWSGLAMAIALGAITAGGVVISQGGDAPAGQANIWVDTNGGSCADSASLVEYVDANACATFDNAWDAAEAGDLIRVKAGTYSHECLTGDKASDTKIIGEGDGTVVVMERDSGMECVAEFGGGSTLGILGTHAWVENVTLDTLDEDGVGTGVRCWPGGDDATLVDVRILGDFATTYIECDRFEMRGGLIRENPAPAETTCFNQVGIEAWIFAPDVIYDGVTFGVSNQQAGSFPNQGTCGADGIPHIETIRPEGSSDNLIIRNSTFVKNSEIGSGHIFMGGGSARTLTLINNYFGESADNPMILQLCCVATDSVFAYNTFDPNAAYNNNTYAHTWVGNLGPAIPGGCSGTHVKNVWGGSGSCGTDTFVGAADLGVDDTGHLESGSPAIDAAETPGASDSCTDAAVVNSLDFEGTVRPQGSVCDAGADER